MICCVVSPPISASRVRRMRCERTAGAISLISSGITYEELRRAAMALPPRTSAIEAREDAPRSMSGWVRVATTRFRM